ncbi:MAG: hypothetical protein ABEN55_04185 [Bradymonadaceae bacterium]
MLATDATVLYIHDGEALHSLPAGRIKNTVTVYSNTRGAEIGGWTVGGMLSTLSHGLTLGLSAPIWLITGISASAVESSSGRDNRTLPDGKRARFPQGLPPSFEKETENLDPGRVDSTSAPELAGGCPPSTSEKM